MVGRLRFLTLALFILFLFASLLVRLFYWQVIKGEELASLASKQYVRTYSVSPKRGQIYLRDRFPLTLNQPVFLVVGLPKEMKDKHKVIKTLSTLLSESQASIEAKLSDQLFWVPIKHKIDETIKKEIEGALLSGVTFEDESMRFYPEASMASHLLGFVGSDVNGEDKGYFGLEGFYDRELKGRGGVVKTIIDALGRPILLHEALRQPIVNGRSLVLTIDRTVQFFTEAALTAGIQKYEAKGGSVIVMDPKTGAILAMASEPSYDPAKWQEFDPSLFKNPSVATTYEPGSIFKVLVMAAAINEDIVKPDTQCDMCEAPISLGGFTIRTWNNKYYKNTTMTEVIEHSDNTGMVFVTKKLGLDTLYAYLEKFGIGRPTGVDLEDEESPSLRAKTDWHEIELATVGFGQGIAVTPLQMVVAVSSIANGGEMVRPYVVKSVVTADGKEIVIEPKTPQRVLSEKTAKIMTEIMVNAVERGESRFAKVTGFRIAGKTGTAQIPIKGHYDPNRTIASFVGFAPANDPRFVILVKIDEPKGSEHGATTAAPVFFDIAKQLFTYYKIPPS